VTTWFLDGGFSSPKNRHIFEIFLWKFPRGGAFSRGRLDSVGGDWSRERGRQDPDLIEDWNREPGYGVPCFVPWLLFLLFEEFQCLLACVSQG
jgi:hypothetical protein